MAALTLNMETGNLSPIETAALIQGITVSAWITGYLRQAAESSWLLFAEPAAVKPQEDYPLSLEGLRELL